MLRSVGQAVGERNAGSPTKLDAATLRERLAERARKLERTPPMRSPLMRNAALLGERIGLGKVEQRVLALTTALRVSDLLYSCLETIGSGGFERCCHTVARLVDAPVSAVRRALSPSGTLRRTPVIVCQPHHYSVVLFLAESVEDVLTQPLDTEAELLGHFMTQLAPPQLTTADFPHLSRELDVVLRYLRGALRRRKAGANVLLYGPPGTGKSQLAAALAHELRSEAFEVNLEERDRLALDGRQRLGAYALCQRMVARRRRTLLVFDEAEDAFPDAHPLAGGGDRNKAWINRTLEQNPVPAVWLSNSLDGMDRAHVRRFDIAICVGVPPRGVRRRIVDRHLAALPVSESARDAMADADALSPGHIERAGKVARLLHDGQRRGDDLDGDLDAILRSNLRAFTGRRPAPRRPRCVVDYDLSLVNTTTDLAALRDGLARTRRGTLCLHGPPGTGKTEYAHHIGNHSGMRVLEKRASDLLQCYLGETEQAIAAMFEEARAENALLLLDEADSFLRDRFGAVRSWEVTQVNELLTQIERFDGVFVCTTNMMTSIDRAALRRFDVKAEFGYLTPAGVETMFARTLQRVGEAGATASAGSCRSLKNLTPGDFAAVARKCEVTDQRVDAEGLVGMIEEEAALKGGPRRSVGF